MLPIQFIFSTCTTIGAICMCCQASKVLEKCFYIKGMKENFVEDSPKNCQFNICNNE